MGDECEVEIKLLHVKSADRSTLAEKLQREIKHQARITGGIGKLSRKKESPESMDFGSTLVLVLAAPAIVALAKALHDWGVRENQGKIIVNDVEISGLKSEDISSVVSELTHVLAKR